VPDEKTKNPASADELKINDNELLRRFLRKNEADASYSRISARGIGNMVSLQSALADDSLREALAKVLEAEGTTVGDKQLAKFFRAIGGTNASMDKLMDGVDRTVPKERVRVSANAVLKDYLAEKGFGPELMPVFESRGITSLESLNRVIAKKDNKDHKNTYTDLLEALGKDTEIDGKIYPGSAELAEGFKVLSEPEIESVQEIQQEVRQTFRQTGLNKNAQKRYSQLKQAVQEVDALRQKDADAAKSLAEGISKDTQARLDSILSRANSRELLSVFDKHAPVTVKDLNTALDAVSDRLISGAQDSLDGLIERQKEMSEEELAEVNCIRRGVLITATGIYECSGSNLVKGYCDRGTPGPYEEVTCDYESEQNYQLAEKTIKESSHTYSTSNSILGGFFSSSGIGAASGAFQYAQSTMSSEAKSRAEQTGNAVKVKERSIYAPKAVLTLPREKIHLSPTALRYLKLITAEKDQQRQNEYARLFLANFGGHVFRSVTLGGRYSYVAKAESTNKTTYEDLNSALSDAQETAGSSSAGFFGSFLLGGSSAHQDKKTSASATSMTTTAGKQNQTVRVSISVRGGLQEMPLDQWKQSLLLEKWWRVIDRREAIAVWDLLRVTEVSGLDESKRKELATLLERVWVRDVFLASLAESKMAGYQKFAQILKIE
jgi:hypothetical protein